jgi:hypothetical protein
MHFEDLLSRYVSASVTAEERARMEAHLGECRECRGLAESFRSIDRALRGRLEPPSGWRFVERSVHRALTIYRMSVLAMIALGALSFVGGVLILTRFAASQSLWITLLGCSLLADTGLISLIGMKFREEYRRLRYTTGSWEDMRREWQEFLREKIAGTRRRLRVVLFLWPGVLALTSLVALLGRGSALATLSVGVVAAVACLDPWITSRKLRNLVREDEALRGLQGEGSTG